MPAMRGNIPRRQPDPSRKPEPRPIIVKQPQDVYHDAGVVSVPVDGYASIYERRFARPGAIEFPSIYLTNVPDGVKLGIEILQDNEKVYEQDIAGAGKNEFASVPVSADHKYSVWLVQKEGKQDILLNADISFVFQESSRG
jgi:hypothetical protein